MGRHSQGPVCYPTGEAAGHPTGIRSPVWQPGAARAGNLTGGRTRPGVPAWGQNPLGLIPAIVQPPRWAVYDHRTGTEDCRHITTASPPRARVSTRISGPRTRPGISGDSTRHGPQESAGPMGRLSAVKPHRLGRQTITPDIRAGTRLDMCPGRHSQMSARF